MKDLSTRLKLDQNHYSRIIVGAVFGIFIFTIWPFIHYYVSIEGLADSLKYTYLALTSITALLASLVITRIPQKELATAITTLCFIIALFINFNFEKPIKNRIAINSQYFSDEAPVRKLKNSESIQASNITITRNHYNYELLLDEQWRKQTDKGSMFTYYQYHETNNKVIELRPKCYSSHDTALTEIVDRIDTVTKRNGKTLQTQCYKISDNEAACKLTEINAAGITDRIRWYSINTEIEYGIALDFIIFKTLQTNPDAIQVVIDNTRINRDALDKQDCIGLVDWM